MEVFEQSSVGQCFQACADSTRLRILNLLADGRELCVCDIIGVLNQPQAKVSRHLAVLREANLVTQRVESNWRFYRLAAPTDEFHQKLLGCLKCCAGVDAQLQADLEFLAECECCAAAEVAPVKVNVRK